MNPSYLHPRDELMTTMERSYRYRMTTTTGGNLSIRDSDGSIWITPAGIDKGRLRCDDLVRVWPDGRTEGAHRPSSEALINSHPLGPVAPMPAGVIKELQDAFF